MAAPNIFPSNRVLELDVTLVGVNVSSLGATLTTGRCKELGLHLSVAGWAGDTFAAVVETAPATGTNWFTTRCRINRIAANGLYKLAVDDIVLDRVRVTLIPTSGAAAAVVTPTWFADVVLA